MLLNPKPKWHLVQGILRQSEAVTWPEARLEWSHAYSWDSEEPMTCLCGKYPIKEICVLYNRVNAHSVEVGNVCVKKFWGPSEAICESFRQIRTGRGQSLIREAIEYCYERGWISAQLRDYYFRTYSSWRRTQQTTAIRSRTNELCLIRFVRHCRLHWSKDYEQWT